MTSDLPVADAEPETDAEPEPEMYDHDGTTGRPGYTEEYVLESIRILGRELGRAPSYREMAKWGRCSPRTVQRHFDRWLIGVEKAGYDLSELERDTYGRPRVTIEEAYDDARQVAAALGHSPGTREYAEHGRYSTTIQAIKDDHLSWWHFIDCAGLDTSGTKAPPARQMIDLLQQIAIYLDRTPTEEDIDTHCPYPASLYVRVFNSLERAHTAAGVYNDLAHLVPEEDEEVSE